MLRPQLFNHNCCRKLWVWRRKRTKPSHKPLPTDDRLWVLGMDCYSVHHLMTFSHFCLCVSVNVNLVKCWTGCLLASPITLLLYIFHEADICFSGYKLLTGKDRSVMRDGFVILVPLIINIARLWIIGWFGLTMLLSDQCKHETSMLVFFCELSCERSILSGLGLEKASFKTHLLIILPSISFWMTASRPSQSQLISRLQTSHRDGMLASFLIGLHGQSPV